MQIHQDQAQLAIYVAGAKAAKNGLIFDQALIEAAGRASFILGWRDMQAWLTVQRQNRADLAVAQIGRAA